MHDSIFASPSYPIKADFVAVYQWQADAKLYADCKRYVLMIHITLLCLRFRSDVRNLIGLQKFYSRVQIAIKLANRPSHFVGRSCGCGSTTRVLPPSPSLPPSLSLLPSLPLPPSPPLLPSKITIISSFMFKLPVLLSCHIALALSYNMHIL